MSKQDNNSTSGGIGFCGLLTIVFIMLKLIGKIGWSWWWVLSPSLIPLGIGVGLLLIAGVFILIGHAVRNW